VEPLTLDTFAPHVGSSFVADGAGCALELIEATALPASGHEPRPPFSLVFNGPPDPLLPQASYALTHPTLGELEIFIVPIARDADAVRYEAVFA